MKRFFVIAICFALALFCMPVIAQDATVEAPACDLPNLQNDINYFIGELGKLKNGTETDPVKIADQLQILANGANSLRASCDGLAFADSGNKVIGPVTFPSGIYKATAKGNDNGINVIVTATSGECGAGLSYYTSVLFSVTNGEATFGSKGCSAILEIKSYGEGDWKLTFERLSTS